MTPGPAGDVAASDEAGWDQAVQVLQRMPRDATVLLACHVNPDGDAIGSMLALGLGLRAAGFTQVAAGFSGPRQLPPSLAGLPGDDMLVAEDQAPSCPDLVVALDAASIERLGGHGAAMVAAGHGIVLDHHASNTRFGKINLVDPAAPATAVVVEKLLRLLDVPIDRAIAECLYVALATDTGSFRFSVTPVAHEMAARLIATGIDAREISRRLFDNRPFGAVRLFGEVLHRAVLEPESARGHGLVWAHTTLDDLARYGQEHHVLDPLIDALRCAAEAEVACLVKEVDGGDWSVSLRSRGWVDVSQVAVALGGGGHRAAAGFTAVGTVTQVVDAVRRELGRDRDRNPEKIDGD